MAYGARTMLDMVSFFNSCGCFSDVFAIRHGRCPLLGIVAWKTKKILRTHNDLSMEMHSNEGESVTSTLIDRKRKRFTTRLT